MFRSIQAKTTYLQCSYLICSKDVFIGISIGSQELTKIIEIFLLKANIAFVKSLLAILIKTKYFCRYTSMHVHTHTQTLLLVSFLIGYV